MKTTRRRYFVAEGPEADTLKESVLAALNAHRDRMQAFLAQFNTTICSARDGVPSRIMLPEGSEIPKGLKLDYKQMHEGKAYIACKPVLNVRAGKDIKKQMQAVGMFNASDMICRHYNCRAMIYGGNGSMWMAAGWIHPEKGTVVVQVPEDEENLYMPHPTFREIKKSEYIALTEE